MAGDAHDGLVRRPYAPHRLNAPFPRAEFREQYARVMGSIMRRVLVRLTPARSQEPLHGHGADAGLSRYLAHRQPALPEP